MKGIRFLVDDKGAKQAVQLDLRQHSELWEDMYDQLISEKRKDEPRDSLEDVRKLLTKAGKLGG